MTTATVFIERPQVPAFGFTTLPNALFECLTYNLKPRDLAVLNYLLTKKDNWKVNVPNVAKHCCICPNTVYAALKVLQERGIAWWRRLKTGKTQWFIRLPESAATPVVEPHTKKPHPKKPHPKFYGVLTNNNKETIIKKTTTEREPENQPICEEKVVVLCEEKVDTAEQHPADSFQPVPNVTVLEKMNAEDKQAALNALNKIPDTTTQAALLFRLNKAIISGVIKATPLVYLYTLIGKVKNGSFDLRSELIIMKKEQEAAKPKPVTPPKSPQDYKAERLEKLRRLVIKHPEAITELQKKVGSKFWYMSGYGMFTEQDFIDAGVI
jgi:hypothetical protein